MAADTNHVSAMRKKFRDILSRDKMTIMPGGFSPLYARMAEEIGFESFFIAGSQMSAFLLGVPDNGILGLRDMVDHCRHVAARAAIPIQLDADTGFGNAVNVDFAVEEIIASGVAACNFEDQESPKKSATMAGRRTISKEEHVGKIKAAVARRDQIDPDFAICARNDTLGAEGTNFPEALDRCIAYVEEGGADYVWLNSVETREDLKKACKEIPAPVQVIWGGKDAAPSPAEYEDLGVRIALYPVFFATIGMTAAWHVMSDFKARGPVALADFNKWVADGPYGLVNQKMLTNADRVREVEDNYLTEDDQRDYENTWGH
ncbi:MAG: isocitrate lyase/PEP mutase family protein [Rhodospirillaceae bacterium]|nr:isocitrate lyase/PEP mutase family protein [Rhodospirillaceae bacterium]